MSKFKFSEENEKKFETLLTRYPNKASLSLPSLWMVQYQDGWISEDAIVYIAKKLDTSAMDIQSIASYYTMFNLKPVGTHHIKVCKTLSCKLCGSEEIRSHLQNRLGIKFGQTSKDMKFTLSEVECLGACGEAPVMSFNDDYVGDLTIEKIDKMLDEL